VNGSSARLSACAFSFPNRAPLPGFRASPCARPTQRSTPGHRRVVWVWPCGFTARKPPSPSSRTAGRNSYRRHLMHMPVARSSGTLFPPHGHRGCHHYPRATIAVCWSSSSTRSARPMALGSRRPCSVFSMAPGQSSQPRAPSLRCSLSSGAPSLLAFYALPATSPCSSRGPRFSARPWPRAGALPLLCPASCVPVTARSPSHGELAGPPCSPYQAPWLTAVLSLAEVGRALSSSSAPFLCAASSSRRVPSSPVELLPRTWIRPLTPSHVFFSPQLVDVVIPCAWPSEFAGHHDISRLSRHASVVDLRSSCSAIGSVTVKLLFTITLSSFNTAPPPLSLFRRLTSRLVPT
jgi:hypothetical protein